MDLNKVMVIGRLTRDPEMRTTPTGIAVCSFGVATNFVWTNAEGQRQEKTEFHNIVAWKKLGEICGQYLRKASRLYLEGHLQTRDWVGQDGVKKYRTEVVADNMIMLDSKPSSSPSTGASTAVNAAPAAARPVASTQEGPVAQQKPIASPAAPVAPVAPVPSVSSEEPAASVGPMMQNSAQPSEVAANPAAAAGVNTEEDDDIKVEDIPF